MTTPATVQHTPGPWVIKRFDESQTVILQASGEGGRNPLIAIISVGEGRPDGEANARLIALAPAMLAAHEHTRRELIAAAERLNELGDEMLAAILRARAESNDALLARIEER